MSESGVTGQGATMDEGRRQAYLAAMGVDLYLARLPLPHAAPSWLAEWEAEARWDDDPSLAHDEAVPDAYGDWVAESAAESAAPSGPVTNAPVTDTIRVRPVIDALTANTTLASAAQRGTEPATPPTVPLTVPVLRNLKTETAAPATPPKPRAMRVGLAVFEWPAQLRVLIEMADPDAPSLSSREHRLWNEIALAIYGREQAYEAHTVPVFRFPPNPKLRHLETPDAIRDAVDNLLQMRQSRNAVTLQLLFAGTGLAAAYAGEPLSQPRLLEMAGVGKTLLLPSFDQLLEDSRLKAPVWQAVAKALQQAAMRA
jgi:hypothetical protein